MDPFLLHFLTKNIHSIVGAEHNSLLGLHCTGVPPFVSPRQHHKDQVVELSLVRRPQRDLLTVLEPLSR